MANQPCEEIVFSIALPPVEHHAFRSYCCDRCNTNVRAECNEANERAAIFSCPSCKTTYAIRHPVRTKDMLSGEVDKRDHFYNLTDEKKRREVLERLARLALAIDQDLCMVEDVIEDFEDILKGEIS